MHFLVLVLSASALLAQNGGTITGTVTDVYGGALGKAATQATNVATKALYTAESSHTGTYTLAQLPAGIYDVSATVPGMVPFEQKNMAVRAAQTVRLDIKVGDFSLNTVGEDRQFFTGLNDAAQDACRTNASYGQWQTGSFGTVAGHIPSKFRQAGTNALGAGHRQRACREPPEGRPQFALPAERYHAIRGHPFTDKTHIIERWRRPNLGHLEVEFTIDDASSYVKPWTIKRISDLAPKGEEVTEYVCTENNKDVPHFVGK